MEDKFVSVRSNKDVISSVLLIVLGCVLVASPIGVSLNIVGAIVFVSGICMLFILKSNYKNIEDGCKYVKREFYFTNSKKEFLLNALELAPDTVGYDKNEMGNALRLDVFYSKEANKAFLQLFEYVPYQYETCSRVFEYSADKIENLIKV